jgi:drug/metabolite transporter (DMT)-like permease
MLGKELLGALFGLASAASWGVGDFSAGVAAKRSPAFSVSFVVQFTGLLVVSGLALLLGEPVPSTADLLWGAAAGIAGAVGGVALYLGLATGRMGIVAPVSAIVSAAIPVLFGLFLEGLPAGQQLLGFGLAFIAVWFVSRTGDGHGIQSRELLLPLAAGLGFGLFLILMERASGTSVLWPLAAARFASSCVLFLAAILTRSLGKLVLAQLPLMALAGTLDTAGMAFYALATQVGRMDTAAVLSSLYPAVTVLLARFVLAEHLTRRQWLGVAGALVAVILIAS